MTKETKKKWGRHYEEWRRSGTTQQAYCRAAGIKFGRFRNKVYDLKKEGASREIPPPKPIPHDGKFNPVILKEDTQALSLKEAPYCEIVFEGGHSIQISRLETVSKLRALIKCLA